MISVFSFYPIFKIPAFILFLWLISTNMQVTKKSSSKNKTKKRTVNPKLSVTHTHKPSNMTNQEWQTTLRKQAAEKEIFKIENIGEEPVYSDYTVHNPTSKNTYKVALRSKDNSLNFCSCPDFKTNLLGTCKHIEAVRLLVSKKRGVKKLLDELPAFPYSSLFASYMDERKIKLRIGSDNKKEFERWAKKFFDADNTLLPAAYFDIEKLLKEAHKINASFRCYDDALHLIIAHREQVNRETLIKKEGKKLLNGLVNVPMFPYQEEGVLFAAKAGRAILADDMGLGKTIQAIAWAAMLQKHFHARKIIIVCPTSLKYQWKSEIEKFTGSNSVTVIEGNYLVRRDMYKNSQSYFNIVSYHMAGADWENINDAKPDAIILDEAQRIKNWKAKISQNIKKIRAFYALILTGTPLENNIEELYSLVQYVNPFLLGALQAFLSAHQVKDPDTHKVKGYTGLNEIGKNLSGILLRRTKKEVLKQLPTRMDKNLFVPMTMEQMKMHEEWKMSVAALMLKWQRFGFLNEEDRQRLMNMLNMMRMVCDSTYIIDQDTNYQTKLDELFNILDELLEMDDEKVVIFSQWERMTRLVAEELKNRNIGYEYLHGGIPGKNRESLFKNFNNDPQCKVFLSTDAGGVGLNLQAAANLINLDIPWNPAVLEQRIGRIYRMGQKRNVSITNLVAQGTIEHKMLTTLKFKSEVASGVLDNGADSIFLDEDRFKNFMESVAAITDDIPETPGTFDSEERNEIAVDEHKGRQQQEVEAIIMHEEEAEQQAADNKETNNEPIPTPVSALVQNGMNFFSQLVNTLSNENSVKQLAQSITEKDEKTGQTYLKLPVDSEGTIEKALNLLGGLLKGFGK